MTERDDFNETFHLRVQRRFEVEKKRAAERLELAHRVLGNAVDYILDAQYILRQSGTDNSITTTDWVTDASTGDVVFKALLSDRQRGDRLLVLRVGEELVIDGLDRGAKQFFDGANSGPTAMAARLRMGDTRTIGRDHVKRIPEVIEGLLSRHFC